jgi:BMFP domain-containing protein YqiC
VGEAVFSYLLELDTTGFNAQKHMPITQAKLDSIADRLDNSYKFIKDWFILCNKPINIQLKDLYEQYMAYMRSNDKKPSTKIQFSTKLKEVGIISKKCHGQIKYMITLDELKQIADTNKWIHNETDEIMDNDSDADINELDHGIEKMDSSIDIALLLKQENDELKRRIHELEANNKVLTVKPKKKANNTSANADLVDKILIDFKAI